jgi:rfaE bifunctional protein nucleotidyltransferase chain/domain
MTVGFTNGCFDILHLGHLRLLNEAAKHCDWLVVGLNSDISVSRLKGKGRPVNPESVREQQLLELHMVDNVIPFFDEEDLLRVIEMVRPDILFKGGDYKGKAITGADFVTGYGGQVRIIPYLDGFSTTQLIEGLR